MWTIGTRPIKDAHYAPYPVQLIETPIKAGCPPDGVVLDPFVGSGTTIIAALKHNRRAIGIELKSEYVSIAEERIRRECGLFSDRQVG